MIRQGGRTGPYYWLERIGEGAGSEVWAAERGGGLVAVKIYPGRGERTRFVEAMRREARIGSLIEGVQGAIAVQEVLSLEGNLLLQMEWVKGPSLGQVMAGWFAAERRGLPASVAVPWAAQVLDALAEVGQRVAPERPESFVHRDIKPHNVLVRPENGDAVVTDFGVARAEASLGFETTRAGVVKGSPRFMAPEVLMNEPLDSRTDQFSVALMLYELVHGESLYDGRDLATLLSQAAAAQVEHGLDALGDVGPLVNVLRTMLSRRKEGRFASLAEASLALRELPLEGPSVKRLLPRILAHAVTRDGRHPYAPRAGETTLADEEDTLVAHSDDERTMPGAGRSGGEPTWEATDALPLGQVGLDEPTELHDAESLERTLERMKRGRT